MSNVLLEDQEFLVHFGVKGMKWGVRKQNESGTETKSNSSRNKKIAAVVGVGAAVVAVVLLTKGRQKPRDLQGILEAKGLLGKQMAESTLKASGKVRMSDIPKPSGKPKISSETQALLKKMRSQHDLDLKTMNTDLRLGYDRNSVPLNLRSYIPSWD